VVDVVDRIALGRWGEDLAAQHLQASGYEVLARNWRCRQGELDIVARARGLLVFVEVKTRTGTAFGEPAAAVDRTKARRIRGLAATWLRDCRPNGWNDVRFDVISVVRRPGVTPELEHLQGVL
jgi:putative endonuclease